MSQIEEIYKQLGGALPSADFNFDSSDEEDVGKIEITNYKPLDGDDITEVVDFDYLSSKIATANENHTQEAASHSYVDTEIKYKTTLSDEKDHTGMKTSFTEQNVGSTTSTMLPAEMLSEHMHTSNQILSMTKLEDMENFMDTLLESNLDETNNLDDASQSIFHETKLSTDKPPTGAELMDELCKLTEKVSSSIEHGSARDGSANKVQGSLQEDCSTVFIDLRPTQMANQQDETVLSDTAKKLLTDRLLPTGSSTNDSDSDSSEDDKIWDSYRNQIKSKSLGSTNKVQGNLVTALNTDSVQKTGAYTKPAVDTQSWTQMLTSVQESCIGIVTSFEQSEVDIESSSNKPDDTASSLNSELQDSPAVIKKVGKKSRVRKHAKRMKNIVNKDQKGKEVTKCEHEDDMERQLHDSKVCDAAKLDDDSTGQLPSGISDNKTSGYQEIEDTDKVKLRLEALISARKGFGAIPSQDVVYHKDATYEPLLCQTSSSVETNAMLVVELDSSGLPVINNLPCDAEFDALKATKSWLISLFVVLATKGAGDEAVSMPFIITGMKQAMIDCKPAIVMAISTLTKGAKINKVSQDMKKVLGWLNDTTVEQLTAMTGTEVPSAVIETVCDDDSLLMYPLSDIIHCVEGSTSYFMHTSFYWEKFGTGSGDSMFVEALNCEIETTVAIIHHPKLKNAFFLFSVLDSITSAGLDLAGVRLVLKPSIENNQMIHSCATGESLNEDVTSFVLALALRGPHAIDRWAEIVGPGDHELAKVTDPTSLSALFGKCEEDLMWFSRSSHTALYATAKWFGGRACAKNKTVFGINDAVTKAEKRKWQKVRFADSPKMEIDEPNSPAAPTVSSCLFAANQSKIILTVSPKLSPFLYSFVFSACHHAGYKVCGIKRMRLNQKRARMLSLSSDDKMDNFTPSSPSKHQKGSPLSPLSPMWDNAPPMPSLLLILSRENAMYHSNVLLLCLQEKLSPHCNNKASLLVELRVAPYSDMVLSTIKSFTEIPPKPRAPLSPVKKDTIHLKEEVCSVCFFKEDELVTGLETVLHSSNNTVSEDPMEFKHEQKWNRDEYSLLGPFELLGIKWLPKLEKHAMHYLKSYKSYIECFKHGDVLESLFLQSFVVVVFRGINANHRIRQLLIESDCFQHLPVAFTTTDSAGLCLASLLFANKELFPDFEVRHLTSYLPPQLMENPDVYNAIEESNAKCVSVLVVKATAFKLFVRILEKLLRHGFKIVGLRIAELSCETWQNMRSPQAFTSSAHVQCYVVGFEYVNAVWYTEYEILSYVSLDTSLLSSVYWSHSYLHAIRDVQTFFPNGLCCDEQTKFASDSKIVCRAVDVFSCHKGTKEFVSLDDSPLTEANCIIVPCQILHHDDYNLASDLDCLVALKFVIVCLEAVCFSYEMLEKISPILSLSKQEDLLGTGTSILIVVKRVNAASCFHSIVQPSDFSKNVIVPKSSSEASNLLKLLFHDKD